MICKICGGVETDNSDGICDRCYKIKTGIFSTELAAPVVPAKSGPSPKKIHIAKDTSSEYSIQIVKTFSPKKSIKRKKDVFKPKAPPCFGHYIEEQCRHCIVNKDCKICT